MLTELLRVAYYHLTAPQAHIFDGQREATAFNAQGKTFKEISTLKHIKIFVHFNYSAKARKKNLDPDATGTESNLEHWLKEAEEVFSYGPVNRMARGVPQGDGIL